MAAPIQKELGLTEKQKSQLKKLDTTMSQKRRQMFTRTRSRQGNTDPEKMRTSMDSLRREQEEAISNILEPKQKTRLGEIELQREGIFAVARTDVAKKLKLTSTQTDKIKTIVDQMRQDERAAMPRPPEGSQGPGSGFPGGGPPGENGFQGDGPPGGGLPGEGGFQGGGPPGEGDFPGGGPPGEAGFQGGGPPGEAGFQGGGPPGRGRPDFGNDELRAQFETMRKQQEKIRATATKQISEVLTAEQKTFFSKMQGKPFDLSSLRDGPSNGPGNSTRATRSTGRIKAQTKQRARRGAEPEPGMEFQPGADDPQ
jgi:Spy/CpxP family protein refolding chaperone